MQGTHELWNARLIESLIPEAYCKLLLKLKALQCDRKLADYSFCSLWPLSSGLETKVPWMDLLKPVYKRILNQSLMFSDLVSEWKKLSDGKVFEEKIRSSTSFNPETEEHCIIQASKILQLPIFCLPSKYVDEIRNTKCASVPIITLGTFLKQFFEAIFKFQNHAEIRNNVLVYALQELSSELEQKDIPYYEDNSKDSYEIAHEDCCEVAASEDCYEVSEDVSVCVDIPYEDSKGSYKIAHEDCCEVVASEDSYEVSEDVSASDYCSLEQLLKSHPCVSCTPDGSILKCCDSVVDPKSSLSDLFLSEDSFFPVSTFCQNRKVYNAMVYLGMHQDTLPWNILLDCAQKIPENNKKDRRRALQQVNVIIECIGNNIKNRHFSEQEISSLKNTHFLPVLQKPDEYRLDWFKSGTLFCPPTLALQMAVEKSPFLVGSQTFIFNASDCEPMSSDVAKFLGVQTSVKLCDVLAHYDLLVKSYKGHRNKFGHSDIKFIDNTCHFVYKYLEAVLQKQQSQKSDQSSTLDEHLSQLSCEPFIWSGSQFVCPEDVAEEWTKDGPFLFKVPSELSKCKCLMKSLGVMKAFSASKFTCTFRKMLKVFGQKIPKKCHPIVIDILTNLTKFADSDFGAVDGVVLPSDDYKLYPVTDLAFNDTAWIQLQRKDSFVHKMLGRDAAIRLGVKSNRTKFLEIYDTQSLEEEIAPQDLEEEVSAEFGQKEALTDRIKNILRDYPFDITFLKEFLQNADDAKATKLFVILDKRKHGENFVPSEEWGKELQGPSVLIWNDKNFTDEDLKGIQSLGLGSKRDNTDSIGEFGIGFNVVYHLTDCPSFFTRGDTLCVLDPCCQYVPSATEKAPGRRFNTSKDFWRTMEDLQSPLMLSKPLQGQPNCLTTGTLFRFPIRIKNTKKQLAECITVEEMEERLDKWVCEVKDSLLFLNYVTCFKMFVIDDKECRFVTKVSYDVKADRQLYHKKLKQSSEEQQPFVVMYPLSITCQFNVLPSKCEKWLIQQGLGDVDEPGQGVSFKETHAIAAPLESRKPLCGRIFCFLPLPKSSGLPVHINGRFVLNSSRQSLWPGRDDDTNTQKNISLMTAICSSYVRFVVDAKNYFVKDATRDSLKSYYEIFPYWLKESKNQVDVMEEVEMVNECKVMAKSFFEKLVKLNCEILAFMKPQMIDWYPICNEQDPFNQVYFLDTLSKTGDVKELLEIIQMKLTCAPQRLKIHVPSQFSITAETVHQFYCTFQSKLLNEKLPCHISHTPFRSAERFGAFINFITQDKKHSHYKVFVGSPEQQPLLLTADENLRIFSKGRKVICSEHCDLFPKSRHLFLHPTLLAKCKLDRSQYFIYSENIQFRVIQQLMNGNFPKLYQDKAPCSVISDEILKGIWKCFNKEYIFQNHKGNMLKSWALSPATNSYLYSLSSSIKPIVQDDEDWIWQNLVELLNILQIPFLVDWVHWANEHYPKLSSDFDAVVSILYEMHVSNDIFTNLPNNPKQDVSTLLSYFSRCSFRHNQALLQQIKSLPLFDTVHGDLVSLTDKTVYLWPKGLCRAGYDKWAVPIQEKVVFLCLSGSWTKLCGRDVTVLCEPIDVLDVYNIYILEIFDSFNASERREHLEYICNSVYKSALYCKEQSHPNAMQFFSKLSKINCMQDGYAGHFLPISAFCSHKIKIFCAFPNDFLFVKDEFRTEKWMEFLKELGMREKLTFQEYVMLCNKVSKMSNHDDPTQVHKASKALVKYLFSEKAKEWYENDEYLEKIKKIKFLVPNDMSKFCWIKEPYKPSTESITYFTCFEEAASSDCSRLVWTVKPVIILPKCSNAVHVIESNLIQRLGITCSPLAEDIYKNIMNISKTKFADFELFFNYTIEPSDDNDGEDLFEIMAENFSKLNEVDPESKFLSMLRHLSCIPVFAFKDIKKPVLVNSYQVVTSDPDESLIPFINILPTNLTKVSDSLLKIGMCSVVSLENIQYLLEYAFKYFNKQKIMLVSPANKAVLGACIIKLATLLQTYNREKAAEILTPLYLPSSNSGSLVPVSELVFVDCARYRRHAKSMNLHGSGYAFFQIPSDMSSSFTIDEKTVCYSLPEVVRPKALSFVCNETPLETDHDGLCEGALYKHFCHLKQLLLVNKEIQEQFKRIMLLKYTTYNKEQVTVFTRHLIEIIQGMKIVNIKNLKTTIHLNRQPLCCVKENFVMIFDEGCTIYIDSSATSGGLAAVWIDISHMLCVHIGKRMDYLQIVLSFNQIVSSFLQLESEEDLKQLIASEELDLAGSSIGNKIVVGAVITDDWKNLYDFERSDENNFCSQEPVGYENKNGEIVWAVVMHLLTASEGARKYRTNVSEDVYEDVCGSYLYKACQKQITNVIDEETTEKKDELKEDQDSNDELCIPKPVKDPKEGLRWIRQAECDYKAMKILFEACRSRRADVTCQVKFMAHEVLEKALKGTLYAQHGLTDCLLHGHEVTVYARTLFQEPLVSDEHRMTKICRNARIIRSFYLDTRYPNRFSPPHAPVDVHTYTESLENLVDQIDEALEILKEMVNTELLPVEEER